MQTDFWCCQLLFDKAGEILISSVQNMDVRVCIRKVRFLNIFVFGFKGVKAKSIYINFFSLIYNQNPTRSARRLSNSSSSPFSVLLVSSVSFVGISALLAFLKELGAVIATSGFHGTGKGTFSSAAAIALTQLDFYLMSHWTAAQKNYVPRERRLLLAHQVFSFWLISFFSGA